jgi:hypothetical protein
MTWFLNLFRRPPTPTVKGKLSDETRARLLAVGLANQPRSALE